MKIQNSGEFRWYDGSGLIGGKFGFYTHNRREFKNVVASDGAEVGGRVLDSELDESMNSSNLNRCSF